jgi:hypothetical protein
MTQRGNRIGMLVGVVGVAGLLLTGCAGPSPSGDDDGSADAPPTNSEAPAATESEGTVDCGEIGETVMLWIEASFAAASTEATNGDVAAQFTAASDAFADTSAPDGEHWDDLGAVIDEYVAQWSALPADGKALENAEAVETQVDAFAGERGFDNDDFSDMAPIVGDACAAELTGMFGG